MKDKKINIHKNLVYLRKCNHLTIEEVADKIGVSRQAVSKWEAGETIPDILNCDRLAELYNVNIEELLHYDGDKEEIGLGPRGKYIFGTTKIGERGQVVIPKQAREQLGLKIGDILMVLGEDVPGSKGIALVPSEQLLGAVKEMMANFYPQKEEEEP